MSDIKTLWRQQPLEKVHVFSIEDLRNRSKGVRDEVVARNLLLYAYSALSIFLAVWILMTGRFPLMKEPVAITILAHLFVIWQVYRRALLREPTPSSTAQAALEFHRRQLEHQLAAVTHAWLWYMVPFLIPFIWELLILGRFNSTKGLPLTPIVTLTLMGIIFWTAVLLLFFRQKLKFRRRMDALNRIAAE